MDRLTLEEDGFAVPFEEIKRLLECLEYANKYRIALTIIALTGCRISELNNMGTKSFYGDFLMWKTGKNQKGYRKEKLPNWFLIELSEYLLKNQHSYNNLFNFKGERLRDLINKDLRPLLKGDWLIKKIKPSKKGAIREEYVFQLKGLRHSFATLDFYNKFLKWGGTVAVEFTCKRMKHSSYKMTAGHYIGNFKRLNVEKYKYKEIADILKNATQTRLGEFI